MSNVSLPEAKYIWKNGELIPWKEATTHVLTHSLHYGNAVFEGIRAYHAEDGSTNVFRMQDHYERFHRSASALFMPLDYSVEELSEATRELIEACELESAYIRPLAYRGYGNMGVNPAGSPTDVIIAAWNWGAYLGEDALEKGITAGISSWRQRAANAFPPAIKSSGNYLNSSLAKQEAIMNGFDEAILLNEDGLVAEGSGENIFVVRDGILLTPPCSDGVLEGITRSSILTIAQDLGIETKEASLLRTDLYYADEAFFSGTAAELTPINSIDHRAIPVPGSITKQIQEVFFKIAKGAAPEYAKWLTRV